jgi:hypothetical protein
MLRLLARFAGYWLLAVMLVVAIVDGAKSMAASELVLTSVADAWQAMRDFGADGAAPAPTGALSWPLDALVAWLLSTPAFAVLAIIGILLLVVGRKRRDVGFGREYAARP